MPILRRSMALAAAAVALTALLATPTIAQSTVAILELRLSGVVDPFMADYLTDGIAKAEEEGAVAVLMTIDTPGGLGSSMREITQAILNAGVPVIGYVSPEGARAASAGTFVLLSTHIAAMAPATNVGAAHPVGLAGAIESEKATNDAAASIVGIAQERGRNAEWAETAVRESASVSATEALELGVIDLVAPNTPALLREVDGTTVSLADGSEVVLETTGVAIVEESMGWFWSFIHALLNPNLAFIFFWLGLALLVSEFFIPGGIAGTIGGLMLVASIVALGMLPVQLLGVVLLVASVVFFIIELQAPGIGVPAVAGAAALLLGGWFLFEDTAQVSPLVLVPVAAGATAFFLVVLRAAIRMRRSSVEMRDDTMVGREGIVARDCDPVGVVQVASEEWSAVSSGEILVRGTRVRVIGVEKLRLTVEPLGAASAAAPGDAEGRHP